MESFQNELHKLTPTEAALILAFPSSDPNANRDDNIKEQASAIDVLKQAPASDIWDRGLLLGLKNPEQQIVDKTIEACISRLQNLSDEEAKDKFLKSILDACYLNLSGRIRNSAYDTMQYAPEETQYLNHLETIAAELLTAVSKFLEEHPLQMEHHRSRFLSRARHIIHMEGRGTLAESVVDFQMEIAKGDRSDNIVADQLQHNRKHEVYELPNTTEAALLAYLNKDADLPVEKVTEKLIQAYRDLLNYQTKERASKAILKALKNLRKWFSAVHPLQAENRQDFLNDSMRAGAMVPWNDLIPCVQWQLRAHLELLPGPEHPEDLLKLFRKKYVSVEGEEILIKGLELFQKMPLIRFRSDDICEFFKAPDRLSRRKGVWDALLDLLGTILTGMADFVLTSEEQLTANEKKRNSAMKKVLEQDDKIRKLLYNFSINPDNKPKFSKLSDNPTLDKYVREKCWRVLLRCMPQNGDEPYQNRETLYQEGIIEHDSKFFIPTLEEAGNHQQRVVWEIIQNNKPQFLQSEDQTEKRRVKIKALTDYFIKVRIFDAVQGCTDSIGVMIGLALDDPDTEIRNYTRQAIISAGFELELERELQKRELFKLRDSLTNSNKQVIRYEDEVAKLTNDSTNLQKDRVDCSVNVQELLGVRDVQATDSMIATVNLQISLEEVREALTEAIASGNAQLSVLNDLQHRMRILNSECRDAHDRTNTLVNDQSRREQNVARLQRQQESAEQRSSSAVSELSSARGRLLSLEASPPSSPYLSDDPDERRRQRERYEQEVASHRRSVNQVSRRISSLQSEINQCEYEISSCQNSIRQENGAIRRLQSSINEIQGRIRGLESRLSVLSHEFNSGRARWQAIRERIASLSAQVRRLEQELENEISRIRSNLRHNRTAIDNEQNTLENIHRNLQSLSHQINDTREMLDNQMTRSQELAQAIDSGRKNYDNIAEQAVPRSAEADAIGHSLQLRKEQQILEEQEYKTKVAYGMNRGLRDKERPLTREERKKTRSHLRPKMRKEQ
jgi:archaellum component FlaC